MNYTSHMGLILGFLTYIGWGAGDIFTVFAVRKIGTYTLTILAFSLGLVISAFYIPFALSDLQKITLPLLILNIVLGTGFVIANFLIGEAFTRTNASVTGVIVQSHPAITLFLSALIFKDPLSSLQIFYALIIFAGVALCMLNLKDFKKSGLLTDRGVRLAMIASFLLVFFFTFGRILINTYGWFWPNFIATACFPIALLILKRILRLKEKIKYPKTTKVWLAVLGSVVFIRVADVALNYGIAEGFAATVTPLATASPTLFVILSYFIFKDKITMQQKTGIGISLLGIVLLSFFSG